MGKEKHSSFEKNLNFERLNAKYNRLWDQFTNISILAVQILSAYIIGLLAVDTSVLSNFTKLFYVTSGIFGLLILLALILARIDLERTETKRLLITLVGCRD